MHRYDNLYYVGFYSKCSRKNWDLICWIVYCYVLQEEEPSYSLLTGKLIQLNTQEDEGKYFSILSFSSPHWNNNFLSFVQEIIDSYIHWKNNILIGNLTKANVELWRSWN